MIEAPTNGWTDATILAAFAIAGVVLTAFFFWEAHVEQPMLDLRFWANPRFSAASGAIAVTFFALFGAIFLLTQYLQFVLGLSASRPVSGSWRARSRSCSCRRWHPASSPASVRS